MTLTCGLYVGFVAVKAIRAERCAAQASKSVRSPQLPKTAGSTGAQDKGKVGSTNKVIGRLTISLLKLSVPIMRDDEDGDLLQGVGHVPGTAMPGGLGTVGLAGHRDTYFRPLRGIRQDMDIQLSGRSGTFHYLVDSTEIVEPAEVRVLDMQARPELVLITCYPFHYIGAAPKRFIVHAHLVSALPDGS